jgi:hypothetical protein
LGKQLYKELHPEFLSHFQKQRESSQMSYASTHDNKLVIVNLIQTATSLWYVVYYTPFIRLIMREGLDCINLELTKEKTLKNEKAQVSAEQPAE